MRELRSGKAAHCIYKFFYFVIVSAWGYSVMKDQVWFPTYLGGSGDMIRSFDGHPHANHCEGLKMYILVTMGYHAGGLITLALGTRRNDFIEMGLHHLVTMYLFGGMYVYNIWEIGSAIAYLHDVSDITANVVKMLAETNDKFWLPITFVLHMILWFWFRNIVLPKYVWHLLTDFIYVEMYGETLVIPIFGFGLLCLCFLHLYWFTMFCRLLKKFIH